MKLNERCSRQGFDSPRLHQKCSKRDAGSEKVESGLIPTGKLEIKNTSDGGDQVSIGHQVRTWTAQ